MDLNPQAVPVEESLKAYIDMVKPLAAKKSLTVNLTVQPGLAEIWVDPAWLRRIMYNLLSNSIKFTPAGGTVTVSARVQRPTPEVQSLEGCDVGSWTLETRAFVEIGVADTGIGIKPEDQERIFLEFEQVEGLHQPQQQGTGLGLALTKKLVELHGGRIWVESEVRKGSRFIFAFPLNPRDSVVGSCE